MKNIALLLACLCLTGMLRAQKFIAEGRTALAVVPTTTEGCKNPVVSLNGTWEINMNPGQEAWKNEAGTWKKVQVPGEPAMQGYKVTNDREFFYRTTVQIPADAAGKSVLIRFNGVYSYARVFANGQSVREHFGGFTAWDADITPYITPGKPVVLYVGVTDRSDDISYASGYAHHPIGGILREVEMIILPKDHLNRFYVQTDLSTDFKSATLKIQAAKRMASAGSRVNMMLIDAAGQPVPGQVWAFDLKADGSSEFAFTVKNPVLWNQEQPYQYTIRAELSDKGVITEKIEVKTGFRKVEVSGKRLLVNGDPVKLRGACRHDVHPLMGRSTNRYYDSLDVALAREANVNFIRTSHYPPSKDFLEFADRYGIYVQEETAICFVNTWREGVYNKWGETFNDTAYTSRYLGQLSEMIDRDRNHPCVIMWSIGNESTYGTNFQKEYEFVKSVDLTRPVSWTWPGTAIQAGKRCFDIAVAHYPGYDGKDNENFGLRYNNMEHAEFPLLSDEWAHVACYNLTLLSEDPNVKDFWGRSLDSMWSVRFDVPGNLGGAIWGMTDEIFHLPDTVTGYGPWGYIDVWRRKKAEFWNVKKAYSPIRVTKSSWTGRSSGQMAAEVTIKNRFNHTSLKDIRLTVSQGSDTRQVTLPDVRPHGETTLKLPVSEKSFPSLMLRFYDERNNLVDEEKIQPGFPVPAAMMNAGIDWTIESVGNVLEMSGNGFRIRLDEKTGQLISASSGGKQVLCGGFRVMVNKPKDPGAFKESAGIRSGEYNISKTSINKDEPGRVTVTSSGFVDHYPVSMTTVYQYTGRIETTYQVDSIPQYTWQVGIAYPVDPAIDQISWYRKGYWSTYPDGHLSAVEGSATRFTGLSEVYRLKPSCETAMDMHSYYLTAAILPANAFMQGTEAYRATKENIASYSLLSGGKSLLTVTSPGNQAAKINCPDLGPQELLVLDKWDYWTLSWGNYAGSKNPASRITGTAVVKIGD